MAPPAVTPDVRHGWFGGAGDKQVQDSHAPGLDFVKAPAFNK